MSAGHDPVAVARIMETDEVRRMLQLDQVRRKLAPGAGEEKKLKEACDGFEAIFLNKLWQQMRKTVDKDGYLHSKEEESYVGLFDQEMSQKLARAGGMGLGEQLFEQLKERLAEAGSITPSISRYNKPEDLNPLRPDPADRDLMLRPDPAVLRQPGRPVAGGPRDQAAAMAAELARRVVEEHQVSQARDGAGGVIGDGGLGKLLADDPAFLESRPDEDAE